MTPKIHVDTVRRLFDDGNHNAFTDLCKFDGNLYLGFRSCPEGHMLFTSSRILVLRSENGDDWHQVYAFSVPDRDVRDAHFLVFDNKLFVYTGTWWVDPADSVKRDINHQVGYCAWTEDGDTWHGPRLLNGTHGHFIWRAAAHDGTAYLNGRRNRDFAVVSDRSKRDVVRESWLLRSEDGFSWTPTGLIQPRYGDETAFLFEEDGNALAVARSMARRPAQVCRAEPPYTRWHRTDLDRYIGGPLLARWGNRYLVAGRKMIGSASPVTALYWLVDDELQEMVELPSGGDNSYPGFVEISPDRGLLSYYSSHEGSRTSDAPSAIYLAKLKLA